MANLIGGGIIGFSLCGLAVGETGRRLTEYGPDSQAGICGAFCYMEIVSIKGLFLGSSILLFGKTRRYLADRKYMIENWNPQNPYNKKK